MPSIRRSRPRRSDLGVLAKAGAPEPTTKIGESLSAQAPVASRVVTQAGAPAPCSLFLRRASAAA